MRSENLFLIQLFELTVQAFFNFQKSIRHFEKFAQIIFKTLLNFSKT